MVVVVVVMVVRVAVVVAAVLHAVDIGYTTPCDRYVSW